MDTSAYAGDWQFVEGVETVSITPQNPASAEVEGLKALREEVNKQDLAFTGPIASESETTAFTIWAASSGVTAIRPGDYLTDAGGGIWVLGSVRQQLFQTKWRAVATKQA